MMSYSRPQDPRWQGPQRWYLLIDTLKNLTLTAFSILVIVETTLHRKWYNAYYDTVEYDSGETISNFFLRVGMALIPDVVSIIVTQFLLSRKRQPPYTLFHPVYALTQSLVLFSMWISAMMLNWLIAYSDESSMTHNDAWRRMCYGEMGLQGLLTVWWAGMAACSCIAVYKWRRNKQDERIKNAVDGRIELKDVEGWKDSANVDGDRDGLADGSAKRERVFV